MRRTSNEISHYLDVLDWSNRRISAPDAIGRAISSHDEPSLGIREALWSIGRLAVEIVRVLCVRIRSGRITNPEPRR